jgi:hypothetical protein
MLCALAAILLAPTIALAQVPGASAAVVPATDGGDARSSFSRPAGTINATDFGACTWDGAHDVGACVGAALAQASAMGGRTVELPAGRYLLGAPLILPSGVALRGNGKAILTPTADNRHPVLLAIMTKVSNVVVDGVIFDGGGENFATKAPLVQAYRSSNLLFRNVGFQNSAGLGFNGSGVNRVTFEAPVVRSVGNKWKTTLAAGDRAQGISVCCAVAAAWGHDITIVDGTFSDIGLDAINITNQSRAMIANNRFQLANNQRSLISSAAWSAAIYAASDTEVTITRNVIDGATGNAIDAPNLQNATITANMIVNSGGAGIGLFNGVDHATPIRNIVVSANTILNSAQWSRSAFKGGITLSGGSPSNVLITGNRASDTQANPTQQYGVQVRAGTTPIGLVITRSNDFAGNAAAPLFGLRAVWQRTVSPDTSP